MVRSRRKHSESGRHRRTLIFGGVKIVESAKGGQTIGSMLKTTGPFTRKRTKERKERGRPSREREREREETLGNQTASERGVCLHDPRLFSSPFPPRMKIILAKNSNGDAGSGLVIGRDGSISTVLGGEVIGRKREEWLLYPL